MTTLAVTFYDVVLWLHVSAVVVGFGSTFAYAVIIAVAGKTSPRSMPGVLAGVAANDRTVVTVGAVLVLATGIYLAADRWNFGEFFIAWGIVAVLILFGLLHGYFVPNERRGSEAAERDVERAGAGEVEFGPEFNDVNAKLARMGTAAGILVVLTVYVMVAKPFL
jgi:hypothetical protein